MHATEEGHLECVKVLAPLELGERDNEGYDALGYASGECEEYLSSLK